MTELTKDEAREETLRRWRALPAEDRQTIEQAELFSAALADELQFRTMGNSRKVILGWIARDMAGLPPWGNVPPESEVLRMKETAMNQNKSRTEQAAEDGTFLADNFGIAPQNAASLVTRDGAPSDEVEQKIRENQQTGDDPAGDLVPDNDETAQMPVTKIRNNRAGGG